jgi:hypothetical protein
MEYGDAVSAFVAARDALERGPVHFRATAGRASAIA